MARITIVGAGVIGMAIASQLARNHMITVVGKNLPGDEPSTEWASPWAGANFVAGFADTAQRKMMQRDAFSELWRMANTKGSGVQKITLEEYFDDDRTADDFWFKEFTPNFRFLPKEELPEGVTGGIAYTTVVINPNIFLPWMRHRLEQTGVIFNRTSLKSLSEAHHLGHDVLINASGLGPATMTDMHDDQMDPIKGQIMIIRSDYDKSFMRDDGKNYTYVIPRLDGTVILGGIRTSDISDLSVDPAVDQDIVNRVSENLPKHFSNNLSEYDVIGHNVGIRPYRKGSMRIENEITKDQNIVHAYGITGGGYIYSWGVAKEVVKLVDQILFPKLKAKL